MMGKFKKSGTKEVGTINTASLPDIVFMLLFFFMVSTVLRNAEMKVKVDPPKASEIKKLEKKSLVSNIFVGKPVEKFQKLYGNQTRIQLNDSFSDVDDIREFIIQEREQIDEKDKAFMTVSLKVDENTKMGIVTDVKQALRKANALKVNYSTKKESKRNN